MPPPRRTTPRPPFKAASKPTVDEVLLSSSEDESLKSPKSLLRSSMKSPPRCSVKSPKNDGESSATKRPKRVCFNGDTDDDDEEEVVPTTTNGHANHTLSGIIEGEEGVLSMDVEVVDGSGTKMQKLSIPVLKLNIPDLNVGAKQVIPNGKALSGSKEKDQQDTLEKATSDIENDENEKESPPPSPRNTRGGKLGKKTPTKNGKESGGKIEDLIKWDESDSEQSTVNKLRGVGKKRVASETLKTPLNFKAKDVQNGKKNDLSNNNRRKESGRVTTPARKYVVDSDSDTDSDYAEEKKPPPPKRPKESQGKIVKTRRRRDSSNSSDSDDSTFKMKKSKKKQIQVTKPVQNRGRPRKIQPITRKGKKLQETSSEDSDDISEIQNKDVAPSKKAPVNKDKNVSSDTDDRPLFKRVPIVEDNSAPKKELKAPNKATKVTSVPACPPVTAAPRDFERERFGASTPTELMHPSSTSLNGGVDEEYKDLQKLYLAKQIEVLDHDLYLKKLEALQKERALNLPESAFTVDLCNQQPNHQK